MEKHVEKNFKELAERLAIARKLSPFLTTEHAAFYIGLSVSGLEKMRRRGRGPKFRHHGRSVRYHIDDLDSWSQARDVLPHVDTSTDAA